MLGLSCDFKGNDMGKVRTNRENCKIRCLSTPKCTHFTWSKGYCYKKSGLVTRRNAYNRLNYVCGIIDDSIVTLMT